MKLLPLLLVLCMVSAAAGFEVKEVQAPSGLRILKWNTTAGPIRISLNSAGSADLPVATVENALQAAMNAWQNVPNQGARFQYAGTSSGAVANGSDGINSVVWIEKNWPYSATTIAITRYSFFLSDPPEMADADILVNGQDYRWSTAPDASANPQQALTHELGHLLGLSHTSVAGAVMFPFYQAGHVTPLSPDERGGLQFLYGAPVVDFRAVTPLPGALYSERMTQRGLPLPVFRWGGPPAPQFQVEFSTTSQFQKKLAFNAGNRGAFTLTGTQEQQLENLSPEGRVFWRVNSGVARTSPRVLRFKLSQPGVSQEARLPLDEMNMRSYLILGAVAALSIPLLILLLLWSRRQRERSSSQQ